MANRDTPMGLRPLRNMNGDAPRVRKYPTSTAVIYEGQIVYLNSNGSAVGLTGTIANTSAALDILGVAQHYKAASAADEHVLVHQDFGGELYLVQADDGSITGLKAIGKNFAIASASAGSTVTGQSQAELDASSSSASTASAAGLHLKLVEISKMVGNVVTGVAASSSNVDVVVVINRRDLHLVKFAGV